MQNKKHRQKTTEIQYSEVSRLDSGRKLGVWSLFINKQQLFFNSLLQVYSLYIELHVNTE